MTSLPNLKGVATADLMEQVKAGSYSASYINWSRTMQLLRDHAPGWLPELVPGPDGHVVHPAGVGGFLLIRFVHEDGRFTPAMPQAIMDNRNAAIPLDKITARDVTDTHRRGACMAAAFAFGLAYELWAKMPLENGYERPAAVVETDRTRLTAAVEDLASLGDARDFWAALDKAATKDHGRSLDRLTQDQIDEYAARLEKLAADTRKSGGGADPPSPAPVEPSGRAPGSPPDTSSAGEAPQTGTDGSEGDGKPVESVSDAPAENLLGEPESVFKAPTGPRGSKKAAA